MNVDGGTDAAALAAEPLFRKTRRMTCAGIYTWDILF